MTVAFMVAAQDEQDDGDESAADVNVVETLEPRTLPTTEAYRSERISLRKFDNSKWKKVVGSTTFEEKAKVEKQDRRSDATWAPWAGVLLKFLSYALMLGLAILIIFYVLKNTTVESMTAEKRPREEASAPVEDIDKLDITQSLKQAVDAGNLRLAIRIYYLGLLKGLNAGGQIEWKKDKTNNDYLSELFAKDYFYDEIRSMTLLYERVWYGERTVSPESFIRITADFENLDRQIKIPAK